MSQNRQKCIHVWRLRRKLTAQLRLTARMICARTPCRGVAAIVPVFIFFGFQSRTDTEQQTQSPRIYLLVSHSLAWSINQCLFWTLNLCYNEDFQSNLSLFGQLKIRETTLHPNYSKILKILESKHDSKNYAIIIHTHAPHEIAIFSRPQHLIPRHVRVGEEKGSGRENKGHMDARVLLHHNAHTGKIDWQEHA